MSASTPKPALAMAAPAKPPSSVCEELLGMPYHHVSRFQKMAASRPERITVRVMASVLTIFATASATWNSNPSQPCCERKSTMPLKNAAQATAANGLKALVDTTQEIEFAAS